MFLSKTLSVKETAPVQHIRVKQSLIFTSLYSDFKKKNGSGEPKTLGKHPPG